MPDSAGSLCAACPGRGRVGAVIAAGNCRFCSMREDIRHLANKRSLLTRSATATLDRTALSRSKGSPRRYLFRAITNRAKARISCGRGNVEKGSTPNKIRSSPAAELPQLLSSRLKRSARSGRREWQHVAQTSLTDQQTSSNFREVGSTQETKLHVRVTRLGKKAQAFSHSA